MHPPWDPGHTHLIGRELSGDSQFSNRLVNLWQKHGIGRFSLCVGGWEPSGARGRGCAADGRVGGLPVQVVLRELWTRVHESSREFTCVLVLYALQFMGYAKWAVTGVLPLQVVSYERWTSVYK